MKQIYEEIANGDILDIRVPVERKGKDLVVTPEILAMFKPDSNGRLRPIVNTSGKQEMVEDNSAAILAALGNQAIIKNLMVSVASSFEGGVNTETDSWRFQHKFINTPLQALGTGELTAVGIGPALAGYRSCLRIWGIWSDKTDATIELEFSTGSGLTTGPALLDVETVAAKVADYAPGILWEGSAVNEAISVATAVGQCQADQKFLMLGDWWHELV